MSKRPSETKAYLRELLAAALRHVQVDAEGRPLEGVIPYADARKMTAAELRSLFHFDHGVHHAIDGPAEHWNLTPRLIADHRQKTKADVKQLAKTRRLALAREAFEEVMARKGGRTAFEKMHEGLTEALDIAKGRRSPAKWGSVSNQLTEGQNATAYPPVAPHRDASGDTQLALPSTREAQRPRWASRPMPGTKRSGLKKRMNGKVERR